VTKRDTCLYFSPWRDPATRRPHPTKPGVCRFRVVMPALPNAYRPDMQPRPIRPEECKGCTYFTDRALAFHQPHRQEVIPFEYPVGSE